MGFVDLYGSEVGESDAGCDITFIRDPSPYLPLLQGLLPPGIAWTREPGAELTKLLEALSYEFARVERRAAELLAELDPRATLELLPDWERILALPDDCFVPTTTADRQKAVHGKLTVRGDQSEHFYLDLAAELGFTVTEIKTYEPFVCGDPCGKAIYGIEWAFAWTVVKPTEAGDALLECLFQKHTQSHTHVSFERT